MNAQQRNKLIGRFSGKGWYALIILVGVIIAIWYWDLLGGWAIGLGAALICAGLLFLFNRKEDIWGAAGVVMALLVGVGPLVQVLALAVFFGLGDETSAWGLSLLGLGIMFLGGVGEVVCVVGRVVSEVIDRDKGRWAGG